MSERTAAERTEAERTDVERTAATDATGPIDTELLGRLLTETVTAVPGVLRIEPSLTGAMRALVRAQEAPRSQVELTVRDREVDVSVSIATSADHEARDVAHQVRDAVAGVVRAHDGEIGELAVCVLSVDAVAAG